MLFRGSLPRPQPKPSDPPPPETLLAFVDKPIVGDYVDDDDAPIIMRPVLPGDRPPPTVLTPEMEARVLGPRPLPSIRPDVKPKRPPMPYRSPDDLAARALRDEQRRAAYEAMLAEHRKLPPSTTQPFKRLKDHDGPIPRGFHSDGERIVPDRYYYNQAMEMAAMCRAMRERT